MSLNYSYLFTYGVDKKKLPSKRDIKRAVESSIYEAEGNRDLKIQVGDETIHLSIGTASMSCAMEVFITKEDPERWNSIYLSKLYPCYYFESFRQKLITEAFLDSAKILVKSIKNPISKEEKENSIKGLFEFAFSDPGM